MTTNIEVVEFSELASNSNNSSPSNKVNWAVKGRNIYYEYGTPMRQVVALRNVSINIPQGVIYGLLGPSGCGKTTILRCLLGRLKPSSGSIHIFGSRPGSFNSLVPGPGIGYMPQELALWMQFTARETINYFGQLYGLSKEDRKNRVEFLLKFLDLKDADRRVEDLSGGQRRRVSLGAALVHRPPLVILDEPTVGVDPLLREAIWKHLVDLTKNDGITAIITTHYIEEARQADMVGLMREGNILVEDNPDDLMVKHNKNTLEAIFLKICHDQKSGGGGVVGGENNVPVRNKVSLPSITSASSSDNISPIKKLPPSLQSKISVPRSRREKLHDSWNKVYALTCKTAVRLLRNIPILLFQLVLPTIQIVLFCLCIGQEPRDLEVAVYNQDFNGANYSQRFLNSLDSQYLKLAYKDSKEDAIESVKAGKAHGAIVFSKNYSRAFDSRFDFFEMMGGNQDQIIADSTIDFYADATEFPNTLVVITQLATSTQKYILNIINETSPYMAKAISEPLLRPIDPPIYGSIKPLYRDFMAPGLILGVSHFLAVGLTALCLVMDRKEGLLERSFVAGVKAYQIILSHIIIQFVIILIQILLLLFTIFVIFQVELKGSIFLVLTLTLLQGIAGMSFGFLISSICHEEQSATILSVAVFYPNLVLSGTVWPLEAMPEFIRDISYTMPQTLAIKSLRFIITRGWDLTYFEVLIGFITTGLWIVVFNFLAVIIFAVKK